MRSVLPRGEALMDTDPTVTVEVEPDPDVVVAVPVDPIVDACVVEGDAGV